MQELLPDWSPTGDLAMKGGVAQNRLVELGLHGRIL